MSGSNASDLIGKSPDRRTLIAVVYADMVGYSRLIGLDDVGTLERLRTLRSNLIDPAIDEHGGKIVQTGGDSLLIVFDSIEGAVRCTMKVQQQVPILDRDQHPDRAIRFRVGINIGDAIADGTDLHGDAVNVAARIQAECPPGGICVTRAVRDHVQDRLGLSFEELGPVKLKNIARPVEAFVVITDGATVPKSVEHSLLRGGHEILPLPDKPSIAVLAFTNMSGDLDQEYFSDGISEDIITELSRSRSLFVIARNTSFTYKGHAVDLKQVARELGVRYILEGSVRRNRDRVRVTAQLVDAETSNHLWAERYDRQLADIFSVQDEITVAVATAIQPAIADAELRRTLRKQPENLGAWEAYQRGLWHLAKANQADNAWARDFFHQAIAIDATFAAAYSGLALACRREGDTYATLTLDEAARLAETWARKAVEIDSADADALAVLAFSTPYGNREEGYERIARAIGANPNSSRANGVKGAFLLFDGHPLEGREALLTALRLNPRDSNNAILRHQIAISYYFEREYSSAAEAARHAIAQHPEFPLTYRWLAAALGQLGRADEAGDALRKAIEVSPKSFEFYTWNRPPWHRPEDHEHMLDGLRKAGWDG